jgi:hypothetical protein
MCREYFYNQGCPLRVLTLGGAASSFPKTEQSRCSLTVTCMDRNSASLCLLSLSEQVLEQVVWRPDITKND